MSVSRETFKEKLQSTITKNHDTFEIQKIDKKSHHNLSGLNDYLFNQLEKLDSKDIDLDTEIRKTYAITSLAEQIVNNANTCLKAVKTMNDYDMNKTNISDFIGLNENN